MSKRGLHRSKSDSHDEAPRKRNKLIMNDTAALPVQVSDSIMETNSGNLQLSAAKKMKQKTLADCFAAASLSRPPLAAKQDVTRQVADSSTKKDKEVLEISTTKKQASAPTPPAMSVSPVAVESSTGATAASSVVPWKVTDRHVYRGRCALCNDKFEDLEAHLRETFWFECGSDSHSQFVDQQFTKDESLSAAAYEYAIKLAIHASICGLDASQKMLQAEEAYLMVQLAEHRNKSAEKEPKVKDVKVDAKSCCNMKTSCEKSSQYASELQGMEEEMPEEDEEDEDDDEVEEEEGEEEFFEHVVDKHQGIIGRVPVLVLCNERFCGFKSESFVKYESHWIECHGWERSKKDGEMHFKKGQMMLYRVVPRIAKYIMADH